jgi:(p)ppGpp synthase/HD superfamily hydrolase
MVGPDIDAIIVALLHDVIEDTPYSLEHLKTHNFSSEVLAALDAITHRKGETRMAYYERVAANPLALKVKRADIAHNTSEARLKYLDEATRTRLVEKYRVAVETLDRLSGGQNTP